MSALALLLGILQLAPFASAPMRESELAAERGGFRLPNGIDVALTVQTQTAIDGAIVLRTEFRASNGLPTFTIYAPRPGETVPAAPNASDASGPGQVPAVSYDKAAGILVVPGLSNPGVSINTGAQRPGAPPDGLVEIKPAEGAATGFGLVRETATNGLRIADLDAANISIAHFAGAAFGSAIANSGNARSIETQTTVSIDLANTNPDVLGSSLLRIDDLATAASLMRLR